MMYNWQHDGQQKSTFNPSNDNECPSKCGACEDHNHYHECTDPGMKSIRAAKLRSLRLQLKRINTHPLIANCLAMVIEKGPEATIRYIEESNDNIATEVKLAVEENMHLSQFSLEKGFLSIHWGIAQTIWIQACGGTKVKQQQHWCRDVIMYIQGYSYEIWKARNEVLHGASEKESNIIKAQKCKDRIKQLYQMPRTNLTLEDKKIFKLPMLYRQKLSINSMRQWIELCELVFQKSMERENRKKLQWYFPHGEAKRISNNGTIRIIQGEQEERQKKQYRQTTINRQCWGPQGG